MAQPASGGRHTCCSVPIRRPHWWKSANASRSEAHRPISSANGTPEAMETHPCIAVTGDVMLGRLVDEYVISNYSSPPAALWGDVLPLMLLADLRLINLECVISAKGREWQPQAKAFHFRAHPRAMEFLKAAQINCVTLANNHVLDYGQDALLDCLSLLDQAGVSRTGAGANLKAAMEPATVDIRGPSDRGIGSHRQ